jgi:hypothetical protein
LGPHNGTNPTDGKNHKHPIRKQQLRFARLRDRMLDDGHVFAVEPRPKAREMTMRSAPLFSPLRRLNNADSYRGVHQIVH